MGETTTNRVKVFVSYSHSDSEWAERLRAHLHVANSKGLMEYWSVNSIESGSVWKQHIESAIKTAKVIVILVSPDFIASVFSADFELPLIEEAVKDGALVIPILIRQVAQDATKGIEKYQFINNKPLSTLSPGNQEELLINVARKINNIIIEHKKKRSFSEKILSSAIGGAVIGGLISGGPLGALLGGLVGGAIGSTPRKEKKEDAKY